MAIKKYVAMRLGVKQSTSRREGGLTSCHRSSRMLTQKELETMKAAHKQLGCTDYWRGECLGRGSQWRELKEANKPPSWPKYTKLAPKMGGFLYFQPAKSPKMSFFAKKYLIRYTPKTFFEEYINFKTFHYQGVVELNLFKVS